MQTIQLAPLKTMFTNAYDAHCFIKGIKESDTMFGPVVSATYDLHVDGTVCRSCCVIQFTGSRPMLRYGATGLTPIDDPSRFGKWSTKAERKAFMLAFLA
jgi:hypothetical protein